MAAELVVPETRLRRRLRVQRAQIRARVYAEDLWPYTTRVMPWGLAAFLALVCLVPFDSVSLNVSAPIDLTLDRLLLAPLALLWIASLLSGGLRLQRVQFGWVGLAVLALLVAAVLSVVVNLPRLGLDLEVATAIRRSGLLISYAVFFLLMATGVRRDEVGRFLTFYIALASITAIGTLYEYRFGVNPFYDIAKAIFPPPFDVELAPTTVNFIGRSTNVGPTSHGLALTVLLTLALPFALIGLHRNPRGLANLCYVLAVTLLLAGAVASLRKTAVIMPAAAALVLTLMRPRAMASLLPLGVVVVLAIQGLAPSALGQINSALFRTPPEQDKSTSGRTDDYDAVGPDVWAHPFVGRGFGTYTPREYRYLDNQFLLLVMETGLAGLSAFLALLLAMLMSTKRLLRSRHPGTPALAAGVAAGSFAFFISAALFDALTFPQAPYAFFLLAGLTVALTAGEPQTAGKPQTP